MCQSKEHGGKRCLGYHTARVGKSAAKLQEAETILAGLVDTRMTRLAKVEELKQEKRNIRLTVRTAQRKATPEELERIATADIEISQIDTIRKADENNVDNAKWRTAMLAAKNYGYQLEQERNQGQLLITPYSSDILLEAVKVDEYVVESPEWHAQRATGIGGSDISSIMSTSPFMNEEKLFLIKTGQLVRGRTPDQQKSARMALGDIYEPILQRRFASSHPEMKVWNSNASWKSSVRDYHLANVDGLYSSTGSDTPDGVLEIKAVSEPSKWLTAPPIHYRQQCLWYMSAFGMKHGKIAVLINGLDYKEFDIIPEVGEMEEIFSKVNAFQKNVAGYKATHSGE
jgi:putative phage-type endonuclease